MAQPNYQLLKLYVDTIAYYDGSPYTLNIFIESCENLIAEFSRPNDNQLNQYILRAILSKLQGRALTLVGSRSLADWDSIKNALNLTFGDQRNIDCLVQDLIVLTPNKNETPYNFGMRCQDVRSLITSKLHTLNYTAAEKIIYNRNYDNLALKTFIRNLPSHLQNNIRLRDPANLENAMALVVEEENFLYSQNRSNALNSQNKFEPTNRHTAVPSKPNPNIFSNPNIQNRIRQNIFPNTFQRPSPFQNNFSNNRPFFSNNFQNNSSNNPYRPFPPVPFRPNNSFQSQQSRPNNPFARQNNFQPQNLRPPQQFHQNNSNSGQFRNPNAPFRPEPMDTTSAQSRRPTQNFNYHQNIDQSSYNDFYETFDDNYMDPNLYNFYENDYYGVNLDIQNFSGNETYNNYGEFNYQQYQHCVSPNVEQACNTRVESDNNAASVARQDDVNFPRDPMTTNET